MAVIQNIRSLKFFNQSRNNDDFNANTSDYTDHFAGNIGELLKAEMKVDLSWYASAQEMGYFDVFSGYIIAVGNFLLEGFEVGQTFEFYPDWSLAPSSASEFVATVDAISQNGRRLDFTVTSGSQSTTGTKDFDAGIWAQADLSAVAPDTAVLSYALAPNNTNPSYAPAWFGSNIDIAGGATLTMSWLGQYQDRKTGSCTIKRDTLGTAKNAITYEIVHTFRVAPFYELSYLPFIQNGTIPPDWSANLNYFFQIEFKHGLNSTRAKKVISPINSDGLSSWYDDSLGGYYNRYSVSNVSYQDTASSDTVTGLQTKSRTTVSFEIDKAAITGSAAGFTSGDKVILYVAYLPDRESEYIDTPTDLESNYIFDSLSHVSGTAASTDTGVIKELECSVSSGTMTVTAELEYTGANQIKIGSSGKYLIFAQLYDSSLTVVNSDRTIVLVDQSDYFIPEYIEGLATFTKFNILTHEQVQGVDVGTDTASSVNQWNEDGVLLDYTLQLDTDNEAILTDLTFYLVARKTADDTYFILDQHEIDLSGAVVQSGIQQINLNQTRGYILANSDQFNRVKLEMGTTGAGTQDYEGQLGQKIKWQDWIFNDRVDPVFLDFNEENDNLNYKSNNYSNQSGYEICILAVAKTTGLDANGISGIGQDLQFSGNIDTYDYGTSDDGSWGGTIYTIDPDTGNDLGQKILVHKNTLFRVVWTNSNTDISDIYAIHRIQTTGSRGDDIEEISSDIVPPSNQVLIPKTGETNTTLAVVGSDIHSECLINHERLGPGPYNLSARIKRFVGAPNFSTTVVGCNLTITNLFAGSGITNIEYRFTVDGTLVDTVNTTSSPYTWYPSGLYHGDDVTIQQTITYSGGSEVSSQVIAVTIASTCYIEFTSNMGSSDTYDPFVTAASDAPYWRLPDDTFVQSAAPSEASGAAGFDGTNKTLRMSPYGAWSDLTNFQIPNDSIVGNLDLSNLVNPGPAFDVFSNSGLTGITHGASSVVFTRYYAYLCDLTGTLDLSPLTGLGANIRLYQNANLTGVTFPSSSQAVTFLYVYSCNITGTWDLSGMTGLGGDITCHTNPNLTGITNPTSTVLTTRYIFYNCNLTGTLDVSSMNLSGQFAVYGNSALTAITNPTNSNVFTLYNARNCNLSTLNVSTLTGLGGQFRADGNASLTSITNPVSSQVFSVYHAYSCDLTGTHDFSNLSGLGGSIQLHDNPSLTNVQNPTSSTAIDEYFIYDCNVSYIDITSLTFDSACSVNLRNNTMSTSVVNHILFDLDATLPGTGTGTIQIDGTNAAPDASTGGFDGITAKNSLISKGYSVITS